MLPFLFPDASSVGTANSVATRWNGNITSSTDSQIHRLNPQIHPQRPLLEMGLFCIVMITSPAMQYCVWCTDKARRRTVCFIVGRKLNHSLSVIAGMWQTRMNGWMDQLNTEKAKSLTLRFYLAMCSYF